MITNTKTRRVSPVGGVISSWRQRLHLAAAMVLMLVGMLVPQGAAATHVDDTWNYSVSLNGSNTVAIKVPVYDEDGADCWVADGKLKMKVDGVATQSPQTVLDDLTLDDISATPREKTRDEIIAETEAAAFADS